MYVKVEQRSGLSAGFVDYEVVECVMLEGAEIGSWDGVGCGLTCGIIRSSY
jgi:hypothetical protein